MNPNCPSGKHRKPHKGSNRLLESLPGSDLLRLGIRMDMSFVRLLAWAPVGCRISLFTANWTQITSDPWVLETISGYKMEFLPTHALLPQLGKSLVQSPVKRPDIRFKYCGGPPDEGGLGVVGNAMQSSTMAGHYTFLTGILCWCLTHPHGVGERTAKEWPQGALGLLRRSPITSIIWTSWQHFYRWNHLQLTFMRFPSFFTWTTSQR